MQKEFQITEDGSHTIYLPEMDEHYHSVHGAIQESMHVYIEAGLFQMTKKEISILEIGFGTGLNAYLTFCFARQMNVVVNYFSLEKYPLNEKEFGLLNYPEVIFPDQADRFLQIHRSPWNVPVEISSAFTLQKMNVDLLSYKFPDSLAFDLVYYDAFAPSKQPEMWTDDVLKKVAAAVKNGGIIVTYCARGTVRRTLTAAGFKMERLPGPVGKKEILRGKKPEV
ncbi:MAG: tRNA (5-methylaminomethyl-2-thiouridine)(34)-methyltransferase MnmD [Prolixibacteraceae bacterium]|nr:tRNA (5-methylaminomethyl-2-thiouridine)(34)-methyltransferase MnmD [Prolixibacteraceae bacterium]